VKAVVAIAQGCDEPGVPLQQRTERRYAAAALGIAHHRDRRGVAEEPRAREPSYQLGSPVV
jgi:hypothetical protein